MQKGKLIGTRFGWWQKGFRKLMAFDFDEIYAHVVKFVSIRTMLALGPILDLEIHQMDVKCAFLNGKLSKEVYMMQLEGFKVLGTK
jgi:hypothetical protein